MNTIEYWQERWQNQQTGWHQAEISEHLVEYCPRFKLAAQDTIFVPLCGKSLDMKWLLEQGYQVIGVETSQQAIQQFFDEADLEFEQFDDQGLICWQSKGIKIYEADYFDVTANHLKAVKMVYDRASLVAIPQAETRGRKDYAEHLMNIAPISASILLVTLDYDQQKMDGPPFAVSPAEVQELFSEDYDIELIKASELIEKEPRFKEKGLDSFIQRYYQLSPL